MLHESASPAAATNAQRAGVRLLMGGMYTTAADLS
jgi:hypothetical protein